MNECNLCVSHYPVRGDLIGCNTPVVSLFQGAPGATPENYLYPTSFDPAFKPTSCPRFSPVKVGGQQ
jgi:hypothetical protein